MSILYYRAENFQDLLARRVLICEDGKNSDNISELTSSKFGSCDVNNNTVVVI